MDKPVISQPDAHTWKATAESDSITGALMRLFELGVVCNSIVDLGCADGHFALAHASLFPGATMVNIDANPLYEPSLKAISETLPGTYYIAAVADHDGEIEITEAAHSYWDSLRPADHAYWKTVNSLVTGTRRVRAITLDTVMKEASLPPPFLLKLDLQGAEVLALRGGPSFLRHTAVVVCEVEVREFNAVHQVLDNAGLHLFDIVALHRADGGHLSWFHAVYLPKDHSAFQARAAWKPELSEDVIRAQTARRAEILKWNAARLETYRARRASEGPDSSR